MAKKIVPSPEIAPVAAGQPKAAKKRRVAHKKSAPKIKTKRLREKKIEKIPAEISILNLEKKESPNLFSRRRITWEIMFFVLSLGLLVIITDIFGIYRLNWQDDFSQQLAKILYLPVGSANGKCVLISDYFNELKLVNQSTAVKVPQNIKNREDNIFYRLVATKLMADELKRLGQSVTKNDLSDALASLAGQSGGNAQLIKYVRESYGLTIDQFIKQVLTPLLLREKLQQAIVQDENLPINKKARERAQEIIAMAKQPGVDFSLLANLYSEDELAAEGGEMGWVVREEIEDIWRNDLFSLPANTVYSRPIKNNSGYYIIEVEGKMRNSDTGKDSIKVRRISIRINVDDYIKQLMDSAIIKNYINN